MTTMTRSERIYTVLFALGMTNLVICCVMAVWHSGWWWAATVLDAIATAICGWRTSEA